MSGCRVTCLILANPAGEWAVLLCSECGILGWAWGPARLEGS